MCLALVAHGAHPDYPLVVAANRDEFHERPTAPARWWADAPILAGRDLRAGGTWLGITRHGRFALLTNYRDGRAPRTGGRSRGTLVTAFLAGQAGAHATLDAILADAAGCDGFNLVAYAAGELAYGSNRGRPAEVLAPGVYGLSNHLLDTPWPKLALTRARFAEWVAGDPTALEEGFALLASDTQAADHELPDTGVGLDWERLLSSAFIVSPTYGTRSSTLLTLRRDGRARFVERAFDPGGRAAGEVEIEFAVAP